MNTRMEALFGAIRRSSEPNYDTLECEPFRASIVTDDVDSRAARQLYLGTRILMWIGRENQRPERMGLDHVSFT